ncbi:DUF4157 domain-containing protein [Streptomyces sp. NPDC058266]|uniref:eCIS core domain-containing protein n=1 Tax=Streptomyces sp. NPDC058266 TaxID=3346412 RepID=UPI0036E88685
MAPTVRPGQHRVAVGGAVPSTGGRPLDYAVQGEMETAFGHDFSRVRVHSGHEASEMAHRLSARAYSVGHDIVLGRGESVHGAGGRHLLRHELAHVVQYDTSGLTAIARQNNSPAAPAGLLGQTVIQYTETPLPGGRVLLRAWGRQGDPIARPGLELKYPPPGELGLSGWDRWHLAGPNATGAEEGIAYTPKNFNIGRTAEVENVMRRARDAVEKQGGEVFFDFQAECRILGVREGVTIRVPANVLWKAEVRAVGSDKLVPILNERATLPQTLPLPPLPGSPSGGTGSTSTQPKASTAPSPTTVPVPAVPPSPSVAKPVPEAAPAPKPVPEPAPLPQLVPEPAPVAPTPGVKPPAPMPGPPTARPRIAWKQGLKAGGRAVVIMVAFAALDYYANKKLEEKLEQDIAQARRGAMPWARRVKAKDPAKPVYFTIKVTAVQYSQYVPFAGVTPYETRLDFSGFEVSDRNVDPPSVVVEEREWDLLDPFRPFGTTTKVTYSEPLIP